MKCFEKDSGDIIWTRGLTGTNLHAVNDNDYLQVRIEQHLPTLTVATFPSLSFIWRGTDCDQ